MRERLSERVRQFRAKARPMLVVVAVVLLVSTVAVAQYSVLWSVQLGSAGTVVGEMDSNADDGMLYVPEGGSITTLYPNGTEKWSSGVSGSRVDDVDYYPEKDWVVWVDFTGNSLGAVHEDNGTTVSGFPITISGAANAMEASDGFFYYGTADGGLGKVSDNGTVVYQTQVYSGGESVDDLSYEPEADRVYTSSSGGLLAIDAQTATVEASGFEASGTNEISSDYPYVYTYDEANNEMVNVTDEGSSFSQNWGVPTSTPTDITADQSNIYLALLASGASNETAVYGYDGAFKQGINVSNSNGISVTPSYETANVSLYLMDSDREVFKIETDIETPDPTGQLEIDTRDYIQPNTSAPYRVHFNDSGEWSEVTDSATVTSDNTSVLAVNAAENLLEGQAGVNTTVNVTASYTSSGGTVFTATKQITVAQATVENLEILPAIWRFGATFGDDTIFFLIVATLTSIVATRFSTAFGGLSLYWVVIMLGWFSGWVSLGILLLATVMCMFIGLNLAANINYGAVGSFRR